MALLDLRFGVFACCCLLFFASSVAAEGGYGNVPTFVEKSKQVESPEDVAETATRPNIVFILADDMGTGEVELFDATSPHGRIPTPNINKLAEEGMRFTNAYTGEAVCAPSRCSLMTGLHTGHSYVRGNFAVEGHDLPLRHEDVTVAEVLRRGGYSTSLVGKWGLGYNDTTGAPNNQGFDYYYGQLDQANCHNMYPTFVWENDKMIHLPENRNASRELCMAPNTTCSYVHNLFTQKAMDVLDERANDPDTPFFLYLAYTNPHAGGWRAQLESGAPVPNDFEFEGKDWPEVEKDHASAIANYLDSDVGMLMEKLTSLGMDENTVVFFASDNGPHNEGTHNYQFFDSNGPFRGFKRSLYEGGVRTPSIVRWKGKVPAGEISDFMWAFWDFLPTAADLAKVDISQVPTDGTSIVPTLLGQQQEEKDFIYFEFCPNTIRKWGNALRKGPWKIVSFSPESPYELYNVVEDEGETTDLADKHPDIVAE